MILVDVLFPEMDKTIDFQLDEDAWGWDIVEEIATMAAQSSGRKYSSGAYPIALYLVDGSRGLDLNKSLRENGVRSGDRLLFI